MKKINPDAICGDCGGKYSEHYLEHGIAYCFLDHTDTFAKEPSAYLLLDFIQSKYPKMYNNYVHEWQTINGHMK